MHVHAKDNLRSVALYRGDCKTGMACEADSDLALYKSYLPDPTRQGKGSRYRTEADPSKATEPGTHRRVILVAERCAFELVEEIAPPDDAPDRVLQALDTAFHRTLATADPEVFLERPGQYRVCVEKGCWYPVDHRQDHGVPPGLALLRDYPAAQRDREIGAAALRWLVECGPSIELDLPAFLQGDQDVLRRAAHQLLLGGRPQHLSVTGCSACGGDHRDLEVSLSVLCPTSEQSVSVTTKSS